MVFPGGLSGAPDTGNDAFRPWAIPGSKEVGDRRMKCLILAAGDGGRIADKGDSKPLLRLAGMPLIERTIATAHQAGITDFYVVTGHNAERVEALLSDVGRRRGLTITPIRNKDWDTGNGTSLLKARGHLDECFVLLMGDHVFDEAILSSLICETLQDGEIVLAADFGVENNHLVDLSDVTRVLADDHRLVDIGKGLEGYNAYDTGIFLCSPAIFAAVEESLEHGDDSLSGAVRRLADRRKAKVVDIEGHYWIDVDTANDLKNANTLLQGSLTKPNDGFISRTINRRISTAIVTPLLLKVSGQITANQVSLLSFAVSLIASLSFFLRYPVIGGLFIQLASILDGSDGEIARLRKTQSPFGSFFDAVLDRYSDSFILFAMFYYSLTASANLALFGEYWTPLVLMTSMLAIFGNTMVSYTSAKSVADLGYRYEGRWTAAGKGRDLRLLLLFVGGVAAWIHPISVFMAISVVAILTNAIVLRRISISWSYWQRPHPLMDAKLKAVIFDFDGTIADTMPFLSDLATHLITANYEIPQEEAYRRYRETTGMDFGAQMERIFPGHPKNREVVAAFEARKLDRILEHPVFGEVIPTLELFRDRNVARFICSSTKDTIVAEYVMKTNIDALVDGCLGFRPGFSKGQQIEFLLQQHRLNPDEVLFVSDSLIDYEFVQDKGVRFIGIRRIFEEQEFQQRGLFSVQDLTALTRLWDRSGSLIQFVAKA